MKVLLLQFMIFGKGQIAVGEEIQLASEDNWMRSPCQNIIKSTKSKKGTQRQTQLNKNCKTYNILGYLLASVQQYRRRRVCMWR